jgi:hypothetical protein
MRGRGKKTYWIIYSGFGIYKENAHKNKVRRTTESLRYFEIHGRYADAAKHVYGLSECFLQN